MEKPNKLPQKHRFNCESLTILLLILEAKTKKKMCDATFTQYCPPDFTTYNKARKNIYEDQKSGANITDLRHHDCESLTTKTLKQLI